MMKKKIYNFLRNNENSSAQKISDKLNISDIDTLKALKELKNKNYIKMDAFPLDNGIDPNTSCFYSAKNKNIEYVENEDRLE